VEILVQTTSGNETFKDSFSLDSNSEGDRVKAYDDIAAMDSECNISVNDLDGPDEEYVFGGDPADGSKGVVVTIYDTDIDFREITS